MATNTWNKIKKKFKWKKGPSRSRKSNRYNAPNIIPYQKRRQKKRVSKSNIFGCLTTVPTEYKQCDIQSLPPQNHNNNNNSNNNSNNNNNSCSDSTINDSKQQEINNPNIIKLNDSNFSLIDGVDGASPTKTDISSPKYILDNVSVSCISNNTNNTEIKYNMTPTPQTLTDGDLDIYDIYEGVLEVENDTIIEENNNNNNIGNEEEEDDDDDDDEKKRNSIELELLNINELNIELSDGQYLLQELWDKQIQIDRNHQIVEILKELKEKKEEVQIKEKEEIKQQQQQEIIVVPKKKEEMKNNNNKYVNDDDIIYDGEIFHNKYIIGHKINEGGFGSVWKIIDNNLYSKCVKIMDLGSTNESQIRRRKACIREYNMTKKAFSDEIIEVELFIDNINLIQSPKAYLIMPYFNGKDLFEFIDDDNYFKKVSYNTMLHIFYKIAEKLYDLHYFKKIVHGDLKPENVMILNSNTLQQQHHHSYSSSSHHHHHHHNHHHHHSNHDNDNINIEVEIIDYGIAKSIRNLSSDTTYLKSKGHFGTKGYVAPELMIHSKYNRKIDVFSCGVVLYNMVTECCLFPKGYKYYRLSQSDYYKYLKKKFKCIKKKKKIIDILYSCLAFDPDDRLDVKQLIKKYFHSKR